MSKIGNRELAKILVEKYEIERADAERFVTLFFEAINDALRNDKLVKVRGLGTFRVISVASRKSVDVNTGEAIIIEGRDKINFTADKQLADEVNRPFSPFETVVVNDGVSFDEIDRRYALTEEDMMNDTKPDADTPETPQADNSEEDVISSQQPVIDANNEPMDTNQKESAVSEEQVEKTPISSESNNKAPIVKPLFITNEQLQILNGGIRREMAENETETSETADSIDDSVAEQPSDTPETPQETSSTLKADDEMKKAIEEARAEMQRMREETFEMADQLDSSKRKMRWILAGSVICVAACIAGLVYLGNLASLRENRIQHLEAQVSEKMPVAVQEGVNAADSIATAQATADSIEKAEKEKLAEEEKAEIKKAEELASMNKKAEEQELAAKKAADEAQQKRLAQAKEAEAQKAKQAAEAKKQEEAKAKQQAQAKAAAAEKKSSQYDKDPRIKYGAYTITGIDHTVTVRAGQTLASISKSNLGPGMECYVEAVNDGRTTFKAGEKVNIPALKLKKKR